MERREREAVVQEALGRVDGEERALLAMHFYGGLTQAEVAEVLDVPRTTVQSRLAAALDSLRSSLRGAGHLAVIPGLEEVMRASPPPPVPDALMSSLLSISTPAAAGVAATVAGTVGGVIVTKKLLLVAAVVAALCLGGGFAVGFAARGPSGDGSEAAATRAANALLVAENRRLEEEAARHGGRTLATAPATAGRPVGRSSRDGPTPSTGSDKASAGPSAASPAALIDESALDWSKFASILAANADRFAEMQYDKGDRMKPADQQIVMEMLTEYMRASTAAKALSPHPFFDVRVSPGLVTALYGEVLGLTQEKRDAMTKSLKAIVAAHAKAIDLDRAVPLETFLERQRTSKEMLAAVAAAVGDEGRVRFEKLQFFVESMLGGDHGEVRLGWDGKSSPSGVGERVLARWKEYYGLDDKQSDAVRPLADRYAADAIDVLRRHGLDKADRTLTDEESHATGLEMLGFAVTAERAIDAMLTDTQRQAVRGEPPNVVVVQPGTEDHATLESWGGI